MTKRGPRLQRRMSTFYIRVKVPTELRTIIGKREFHYSLSTSNLREARQRLHLESVKIDCVIADARRKKEAKAVVTLTQSEMEYLVLNWFNHAHQASLHSVDSKTGPGEEDAHSAEIDARHWIAALSDPDDCDGGSLVTRVRTQ